MVEAILCAIVFIFAIIGLSETINRLYTAFLTPSDPKRTFLIIPMKKEDSVETLQGFERYWHYYKLPKNISVLAVDFGMDETASLVCREYCRENTNIFFMKPDQIISFL